MPVGCYPRPVKRVLVAAGAAAAAAGLVRLVPQPAPAPLPDVAPPGAWLLMTPQALASPTARFRPRPSMRGLGWQVIDYLSALGVLIVDVETHRLDEALGIARALVHPLEASYVEVLVYFRAPGTELAAKRVQWTPAGGYIELDLAMNQPRESAP